MLKYIGIFLLIALGTILVINFVPFAPTKKPLTATEKQLVKIGDRCAEIADKSVANKVAIVEFQKLEIASRRNQVIVNCMQDNGYKQNPQWLSYATPIAKANAEKEKISYDEAITSLSRTEMQRFTPDAKQPNYWIVSH